MEMQVETLDGGVTKVTLGGRMDIAGAQKVDLQFSVIAGAQRKVVVDLAGVSFLASMGIRTLIMAAKSIKSKGGKMALVNPIEDVEQVLIGTGTDSVVPIMHDMDAAIAAVSA